MRVLLLVTVVVATVVALSDAAGDRFCKNRRKRDTALHWPNPATNCSTYFICNDDNEIQQITCPGKRIYNVKTGKCVRKKRGICQLSKAPPLAKAGNPCVGIADGIWVPADGLCRDYYTCVGEIAYPSTCDVGSVFTSGHCVPDDKNTCWQNQCLSQPNGVIIPSDTSCLVYYTCTDGAATEHTCAASTYFNPTLGQCAPDVDGTNCPDNLCTDEPDGTRLPDTTDCNSYYECQSGKAVKTTCPTDMFYDIIDETCMPGICTNDDETSTTADDGNTATTECITTDAGDVSTTCVTDVTTDTTSDGDAGTTETPPCTEVTTPSGGDLTTETPPCTEVTTPSGGDLTTETPPCTEVISTETTPCPEVATTVSPISCLEGSVAPNPENCALFYICYNGEWRDSMCLVGSYFNINAMSCVEDTTGVCPQCQITRRAKRDLAKLLQGEESSNYRLGEKSDQNFKPVTCMDLYREGDIVAHASHCRKYEVCSAGKMRLFDCGEGEYFNKEASICAKDQNNACAMSLTSKSTASVAAPSGFGNQKLALTCLGLYHENQMVANPKDCRKFQVCKGGKLIDQDCGLGNYFDSIAEACQQDTYTTCASNKPTCEGTYYESEKIAHSSKCRRFYICHEGELIERDCGFGKFYDQDRKHCEIDVYNVCTVAESDESNRLQALEMPSCLGIYFEQEMIPDPEDCRSYQLCQSGSLHNHDCGLGNYFDSVSESCQQDTYTTCENNRPTCLDLYYEGEKIEHPTHCRRFHVCHAGELKERDCGFGKFFDSESKHCAIDMYNTCSAVEDEEEQRPMKKKANPSCLGIYSELEMIPDPENCRSYQFCKGGSLHNHDCGLGNYFDSVSESCQQDTYNTCENNKPSCLELYYEGEKIEHPTQCRRFHVCHAGELKERDCGFGKFFDSESKHCAVDTYNVCSAIEEGEKKRPMKKTTNPSCLGIYSELEMIPDPEDCRSYQLCKGGSLHNHDCGLGNYFDSVSESCQQDTYNTCENNKPSCLDLYYEGEKIEHPTQCRRFHVCNDGELKERDCGFGKFFDSESRHCAIDTYNVCSAMEEELRPMKKKANPSCLGIYSELEMIPDPEDCRSYQLCKGGSLHNRDCGFGNYFDSVSESCQQDTYTTCSNNRPTCLDLYYEGEKIVHPTQCRRFHVCHEGELKERDCGFGKFFDSESKHCAIDTYNVCSAIEEGEKIRPIQKKGIPSCLGIYYDSEMIADPEDCRSYQLCKSGILKRVDCGLGNYFDSASESCQQDTYNTCANNKPSCLELYYEGEKIAHPTQCRRFQVCYEGELKEQDCGFGKYFSDTTNRCDVDLYNVCSAAQEDDTPRASGRKDQPSCLGIYYELDMVADPEDCRAYLLCKAGRLENRDCGLGNYFDGASESCQQDTYNSCIRNQPACLGTYYEGQKIEHPTKCRRFQVCHQGELIEQDCGFGKYFEKEAASCSLDTYNLCSSTEIDSASETVETNFKHKGSPTCLGIYYEDDLIAHPKDCRMFQVCNAGKLIEQDCGLGSYFDSMADSCQLDSNNICERNRPTCMNEYFEGQKLIHPANCRAFQVCYEGNLIERDCGFGRYFDGEINDCAADDNNTCTTIDGIPAAPAMLPLKPSCLGTYREGELIADPDGDCRKYQICNAGKLITRDCGLGNYFHSIERYCEPDVNSICASNLPTCFGLYYENERTAHPQYCRRFQICYEGELITQDCGIGQYFDQISKTCALDTENICDANEDNAEIFGKASHPSCLGVYYEGQFTPHVSDCRKYQVCIRGDLEVNDCGLGNYYDAATSTCQIDVHNLCQSMPSCLGRYSEGEVVPHKTDCRKFQLCFNAQLKTQDCGVGNYFDRINKICVPDVLNMCQSTNTGLRPQKLPNTLYQNSLLPMVNNILQRPSQRPADLMGPRPFKLEHNMNMPGPVFMPFPEVTKVSAQQLEDDAIEWKRKAALSLPVGTCMGLYAEGALMPSPDGCRMYQLCQSDLMYTFDCGLGNKFNNVSLTCEPDAARICDQNRIYRVSHTKKIGCYDLYDVGEMVPHPFNCRSYFVCTAEGKLKTRDCGIGNYYNAKSESCQYDWAHVCRPKKLALSELMTMQPITFDVGNFSTECTVCPNGMQVNQTKAHEKLCASFYICTGNGTLQVMTCPECYKYEHNVTFGLDTCVEDTNATCWLNNDNCTVIEPVEPIDPFSCLNQPDGTKISIPEKCNFYYLCADNIGIEQPCLPGEYFNANATVPTCEPDVNAVCINPCGQLPIEPIVLPNPDCNKFYVCSNGATFAESCLTGTSFDAVLGICKANASCESTLCLNQPNGVTFPSFVSPKVFYYCTDGVAVVQVCATDTVFNPDIGICQTAPSTTCNETECTAATNYQSFPTLDDSNAQFCYCLDGVVYVKDCPVDTAYDAAKGICVSTSGCDQTFCNGQPDYTVTANRNDIHSFCVCVANEAVLVNCPNNQIFNPLKDICEAAPARSLCNRQFCADKKIGTVTTSAKGYYGFCYCDGYGQANYRDCEQGRRFDAALGICMH